MIEGLQPYSEYKESAVPWLGTIPSSWRVERTKWVFRKRKELNVGRKCTNVLSLTLRGVVNNDPDSPEGLVPKDYATYQLFRKNDLVFKLIDLENLRTSRVGLVHEDGIMSSAYLRLIPQADCNVRFFYHQFFDLYTRAVFNALGAGVRSTLGAEDLGEIRILLPPPDEQAAIVRFLEHANRKIDGFIRAKRKLIGLLNEQKQAIIHRAVTRGLDPHAPLKPSGIPWLGDIPQHWGVAKFKHFFRVRMGQTFLKPDLSETGELPVLSATMSGAILGYTAKSKARTLLKEGDLVIPARGNSIGYVALVTQLCTSSQTTIQAIRIPNERLTTRFAHLFSIGNKPFLYSFVQTAIPQITTHEVACNPVLLPPMKEQNEICTAVDTQCSGLNTAIARTEREIALMQEYRTRLTADVVTGKLDVREAAAKLPDLPIDTTAAPDEPLEENDPEEVEE